MNHIGAPPRNPPRSPPRTLRCPTTRDSRLYAFKPQALHAAHAGGVAAFDLWLTPLWRHVPWGRPLRHKAVVWQWEHGYLMAVYKRGFGYLLVKYLGRFKIGNTLALGHPGCASAPGFKYDDDDPWRPIHQAAPVPPLAGGGGGGAAVGGGGAVAGARADEEKAQQRTRVLPFKNSMQKRWREHLPGILDGMARHVSLRVSNAKPIVTMYLETLCQVCIYFVYAIYCVCEGNVLRWGKLVF